MFLYGDSKHAANGQKHTEIGQRTSFVLICRNFKFILQIKRKKHTYTHNNIIYISLVIQRLLIHTH